MIIRNAKLLTMEETDYENGYIRVKDGVIESLGDMKDCPEDP